MDQRTNILELLALRRVSKEEIQKILCDLADAVVHRLARQTKETATPGVAQVLQQHLEKYLDEHCLWGLGRKHMIDIAVSRAVKTYTYMRRTDEWLAKLHQRVRSQHT